MILITGDIHGSKDISKLGVENEAIFNRMTKSDYLIICGDFGLIWDNGEEDIRWRTWLDRRNFTTLFVDGNHENFGMLNSYPVSEWHGGKVHMITDSIIHLMRGQIFIIEGKLFFTMGGAESHDKAARILGRVCGMKNCLAIKSIPKLYATSENEAFRWIISLRTVRQPPYKTKSSN